ncbi:MAG: flavocytochrome c [Christensenellaceae bacterium]|nr:flavocytochrome c [Christensenellaceae bacterium]
MATVSFAGGLTDGTYVKPAKGFASEFEVTVVIEGGNITSITVGENNETVGIGSAAIEKLPGEIVDAQSIGVEVVSGATVTSEAIKAAVGEAIVEAGGNLDDYSVAVTKTAGEEIVKEADVIVLGGGGAGLSAAVSAAENGATVILIEKTAALGGNTVRAGGPYNAFDPERQASLPAASEAAMESVKALTEKEAVSEEHQKVMDQLKADLEAYYAGDTSKLFDSVALHILQTYDGGDYAGKLDFIEKLAGESLETSEWMEANGVVWKDDISTVPGGLWPRAHTPQNAAGGDYIKANSAKAEELGAEIILDCKATELIVADGKVVGVKAEMGDGTPVTLNANKGVVIATGGFAANVEMRQKYDPSLIPELGTTNSPAIVGDGIVMAEAVNANLIGMEYIQCLPLGNPATGGLNGWMGGIGVEYYYQVNTDGLRFMAEDGRRDTMTQALLAQKGAMSYVITDTNRESENSEINIWGDNIEELVEAGTIFKADTIEDLAKQIGVDPAALQKTHDDFNGYVEAGIDAEFGRKLFGDKIDKAPFYASPRMPTVHHTMGGIEIDLQGHVLDKDGNIIPGLFAAGEVTGGIHGKNRLGGNALVDIHVFGREAGKNAALGN